LEDRFRDASGKFLPVQQGPGAWNLEFDGLLIGQNYLTNVPEMAFLLGTSLGKRSQKQLMVFFWDRARQWRVAPQQRQRL